VWRDHGNVKGGAGGVSGAGGKGVWTEKGVSNGGFFSSKNEIANPPKREPCDKVLRVKQRFSVPGLLTGTAIARRNKLPT